MPTRRQRCLRLALSGLTILVPLLGATIVDGGTTTTVTFNGTPLLNLGSIACPSTPSTSHLTVTVGAVLHFANRTGRTATLRVGNSTKTMPDNSVVPVTFTHGPATIVIQMLPACTLDLGTHTILTVTVTAPARKPTTGPAARSPKPTASPTPTQSVTAAPAASVNPRLGIDTSEPPALTGPAIGPVTADDPEHASGLLVLIAAVCVIGVCVSAVRVIMSRRTTEPNAAMRDAADPSSGATARVAVLIVRALSEGVRALRAVS